MTELTFYHTPQTRSSGVMALLEELGAPHTLHLLRQGQQREPEFLAVNPMGKVPALRDGGMIVTEQVAVYLYLADRFPTAGLAPGLADPLRGPYLRWMAFYGSSFEPALIDRAMKREPGRAAMSPYGDYDTMLQTLTDQLARGPYILGERFTAADVLWGSALAWTTSFKLVAETPEIMAYVARISARPAIRRAREKDAELATP